MDTVSNIPAAPPIQLTVVVAPASTESASPTPAASLHSAQIHASGPWVAGRMFSVVPPSPLAATGETNDTWYAITRGRFVGVTNIHALNQAAIIRVSGAAHRGYTTQAAAVRAFNLALEGGYVELVDNVVVATPSVATPAAPDTA
ncbi:hypothetical protein B0H13DRAFT_2374342 [Mycena leptocephala]|nr:hypothetical protein B0H13DRAFT_2374342 [Mycena leptocephala]